MNQHDKLILHELGSVYAEIASLPWQDETKKKWILSNNLQPVQPMFFIDQIPWSEMQVGDELTLRCQDSFCRELEQMLRRRIYKWNHMRDDFVFETTIRIPKIITGLGLGINIKEDVLVTDEAAAKQNDVAVYAHKYYDLLKTDEAVDQLQFPVVKLDKEETARREAIAQEAFEGVLNVEMDGHSPMYEPWDTISRYRSMDSLMLDLIDKPDFMHKLINKLTDMFLSEVDQLEKQGLLCHPQSVIHCTGGWTDQLPREGYNPDCPRTIDIWSEGKAQPLGFVSPEMFEEYEIDYAKKVYAKFGLINYGCCERLDDKLDCVKKLPNVRKVSISPWSLDRRRAAEELGKDYIFLSKPNPAQLAYNWSPEAAEADLRLTLDYCKQYGTPVEFAMKDIGTLEKGAKTLWEWCDVMRRLSNEYAL